jgi:hypothetical protein
LIIPLFLDDWFNDKMLYQVPEIYFPLVLRYLANVQGGCREVSSPISYISLLLSLYVHHYQKLKENCQTYLTVKVIPVEAPPSTPLDEADTVKPAKPTPGPLILPFAQPTPGAIVPTAATITSTNPPIPSIPDPATSIKRTRAQSLLNVLT